MATRDNNWTARRILADLDAKVNRGVNEDREFVNSFISQVRTEYLQSSTGIVVHFLHGGSAFEGLAVSENADFDITVLLGKPLEIKNFHIERDESNYFRMRWKNTVTNKIFCDFYGHVEAKSICSFMFDSLINAIESVDMIDAEVVIRRGLAAVIVEVERESGRRLSFDFVPQLVFRSWDECPNLMNLSDMPPALTKYIDTLDKNVSPILCFALAVPKREKYSNGNYLFDISFSMLEKEYFRKNTDVRDMVRLVKYVADRRGWKADPFKFKPMYAKRVAIKNDERLRDKSLWEGYQVLLVCLKEQLEDNGTFDGYFVSNQVTYRKDKEVIKSFVKEIHTVLAMSAEEIKCCSKYRDTPEEEINSWVTLAAVAARVTMNWYRYWRGTHAD